MKPIDEFYLGLPIDYLERADVYMLVQTEELHHAYKLVGFMAYGIILKPPIALAQFAGSANQIKARSIIVKMPTVNEFGSQYL